jgi:hypothetical protein
MALRSRVRVDVVKHGDGRRVVQIHAADSILKPQLQRFWKDGKIAISETGQGLERYLGIERFPLQRAGCGESLWQGDAGAASITHEPVAAAFTCTFVGRALPRP